MAVDNPGGPVDGLRTVDEGHPDGEVHVRVLLATMQRTIQFMHSVDPARVLGRRIVGLGIPEDTIITARSAGKDGVPAPHCYLMSNRATLSRLSPCRIFGPLVAVPHPGRLTSAPRCDWCGLLIRHDPVFGRLTTGYGTGCLHANCATEAAANGALTGLPFDERPPAGEPTALDVIEAWRGSAATPRCSTCNSQRFECPDPSCPHKPAVTLTWEQAQAVVLNVRLAIDRFHVWDDRTVFDALPKIRVDVVGYLERALGLVTDVGVMEED